MYRFLHHECQEKNGIFDERFCLTESRSSSEEGDAISNDVQMMRESEHDTGEDVVPRVRDHARTQTSAQYGNTAEERAVHGDRDHSRGAFVGVTQSEDER